MFLLVLLPVLLPVLLLALLLVLILVLKKSLATIEVYRVFLVFLGSGRQFLIHNLTGLKKRKMPPDKKSQVQVCSSHQTDHVITHHPSTYSPTSVLPCRYLVERRALS